MTSNSKEFVAVASRDLILTKLDGTEMEIYVAVGAPYRPATTVDMQNQAGCLVLTCDDPDLATEICGFDELEALAAAVSFLQFYLISIVNETGGKLRALDGSLIDPFGSIFLQKMQGFARKKEDKK